MIPGSANPLLLAPAAGGYQVSRSLRFNSSDSAYLSRTPAVAGNRRTFTWAGWVKRSALNATRQAIFAASNGSSYWGIEFDASSGITIYDTNSAGALVTSAVYRDVSAWYHIVVTLDTTQTTAANRVKLYVNGTQVTTFGTTNYPSQNSDSFVNAICLHALGSWLPVGGAGLYLDGYLADIHFIDGQALTPSSFTEVSATTGQLIPKAYTGTFGTNGFWLKFSDNSNNTAATLGKDYSPNGNNWTPNNLSVTAGAGNDSLVDTPTSISATDTGVGGEIRGNYATLNPLSNNINTLANGNLDIASAAGNASSRCNATIGISSGKWYFEILLNAAGTNSSAGIGQNQITSQYPGQDALSYVQELDNARKGNSDTYTAYGSALVAGDVFMCAFDLDNSKIFFGKNGTWFNSSNPAAGTSPAFTLATGTYTPIARPYNSNATGASFSANFGQRAFSYQAPSNFKALVDTNLPTPVVAKPDQVFQTALWSGDGASTRTITVGFEPDLIWEKVRNNAQSHLWYDVVRGFGANKAIGSNSNIAEGSFGDNSGSGYVSGTTSTGFSIVKGTGSAGYMNDSGYTQVAWCWDAGTTTASNGSGSITSQVRANVSAGFSIVSYTGTGSTGTLGHGLGVKPQLLIVKSRTQARDWLVYHTSYGATQYTTLNGTGAAASTSSAWNNTEPTSTVFTIGNAAEINTNGSTNIAYCFAPVVGYSSFGSYVGNGSSDGPMVYTGFRPRWIMFKCSSATAYWGIYDAVRNTYNAVNLGLYPNDSIGEISDQPFDFLSNGFKVRGTNAFVNSNAATYVWAAFAESPFQYARAR